MANEILNKIVLKPLASDKYFPDSVSKTQLFVHHTASSSNPERVSEWWASQSTKVAVAFVVGGIPDHGSTWADGSVLQCFSSNKWAWHLGLTAKQISVGGKNAKTNTVLNKGSVGIEICNWGCLTKGPNGYTSYAGVVVPDDQVIEYPTPFRGYNYYHRYTAAQLDSVKGLLQFLTGKYSIPTAYKGDQIFNVTPAALCGEPGIWTHVSVRPDKTDCHPQPELIEMLKSL